MNRKEVRGGGSRRGNDTDMRRKEKENRKLQLELRSEKEKLNSTMINSSCSFRFSFSFRRMSFHEQLISPKEFVCLAGKSTLKDWKRAIRLNGTMLR
ncbi:unnamed protein product [Menidia menidia]|uniref:(Atlantic silverside) hypothetical protein n=1 Tax=Menidia menidia TaxID=238744 RepID=A0A8S4AKP7_9TELE|nr:unnamed protein product [Menidia menidia]